MNSTVRLSIGVLLALAAAAQTPVLRKGVSVQMPVTTNAVKMPDADLADSVVVAVTAGGALYENVTRVTPAQLTEQVKGEIGGQPGKRSFVKADARTPYSMVGDALSALRAGGVIAPVLLTAQHESPATSYVTPMGLEVLVPPPAPDPAQSVAVRIGGGQVSDTELRQQAQSGRPVVLSADANTPFGEVVHALDVFRAAGVRVYLSSGK